MRTFIAAAISITWITTLLGQDAPKPPPRSEAEQKAMAAIRKLGGLAIEVAQNDPRLEVSYIQNDGKFSDEHLTPLKELKNVIYLNLRAQPVTDSQLAHLKDLTTLIRLHLEKTKITDNGLENLKGLTNLEYLNLYGTEITDTGLRHLEGMKKLKNLYLFQTKATDAGVARLKQALPQVEITRGLNLEPPAETKKDDKPKKDDKKDP